MSKNLSRILIAFTFILILTSYVRLFFGVDFIDETWYISVTHVLSQRSLMFVNEYRPQQIANALWSPLYWIYTHLFGFTATILFMRHLYFLVGLCAVLSSIYFLSALVPLAFASFISSFLLLDVFFIPNISYNTMGRFGLAIGLFLFAGSVLKKSANKWIVGASALGLVLGCFSYPPFYLPVGVFYFLSLIWLWKSDRKKILTPLFIFCAINLLCMGIFVYPRISWVLSDMAINSAMAEHVFNLAKITQFLSALLQWLWIPALGALTLLLTNRFLPKRFQFLWLATVILGLLAFIFRNGSDLFMQTNNWMSLIAVILFPICFLDKKECKFICVIVILPFLVAGFTSGISSANFLINTVIGCGPLLVLTLASLTHLYLRLEKASSVQWAFGFLPIMGAYIVTTLTTVYDQGPIDGSYILSQAAWNLSELVSRGPYAGLYTTVERRQLAEEMDKDLNKPEFRTQESFLSYYSFPAPFLYTDLDLGAHSTWLVQVRLNQVMDVVPSRFQENPQVIFRFKHYIPRCNPENMKLCDQIGALVRPERYHKVVENNDYEILRRN